MNSTKCGGLVPAWVANMILGCLPPRTGGGVDAISAVSQAFSLPVCTLASQLVQGQLQRRHEPVHVPAGLGRDVDPRRPAGVVQLAVDLLVKEFPAVSVDQVPLVVGDHQRPARIDHHRDDPQVLLGQRLARIDEDDRDLGPLQRSLGAQRGKEVSALSLAYPPPDPGRVDEAPRLAAELDELVNRVAGRARHRVDEDPLRASELVEQARLPDIRPADERDPARTALSRVTLGRGLRQRAQHRVEQVAAAAAMQGADRHRLAEAERPQGMHVRLPWRVVHLVGRQHDRLARAAEHRSHRGVGVSDANDRVHHEQHGVRGVDCDAGLGCHPGRESWRALHRRLPAARVDQRERPARARLRRS